MTTKMFHVCDYCKATADRDTAHGWHFSTQPTIATCAKCRAKQTADPYDEVYFLHGKAAGVSLYEDYRWLPDLTLPMVRSIITHLGICYGERILDFGCARGYIVKAFREMGYDAYGYDSSDWAVDNCDPEVREFISKEVWLAEPHWIIAKDVLEHIPFVVDTIAGMLHSAKRGVFAVVPLSVVDTFPYVVPCYEDDVTHIHRLTLATWARMFMRPDWAVTAQYRVRGVKDNYAPYILGNGFITARRLE